MMHGGVPIMYFDEGDGPAVLMVHGLGANLTHFEYLIAPLRAAGYRVCGLDMPGFGLSGKPHRKYTTKYLSDALLAVMDHLKLERATLCGHSLGGLVAAETALREPARVDGLVLISSAGLTQLPLALRVLGRTLMRPALLAPLLERNALRLLDLVLAEKNEKTQRFIEQSVTRPDPRFCPDLARVMASMKHDLTKRHLVDEVDKIKVPTLVMWGGRDRLLPLKPVPRWVEKLPAGELEVIEGCGHMLIIENPERVAKRMLAFLRKSRAARKAAG
jgi:pyruvate dehydrogenase E2 component (dihydrolipoamide acetyltransferase)